MWIFMGYVSFREGTGMNHPAPWMLGHATWVVAPSQFARDKRTAAQVDDNIQDDQLKSPMVDIRGWHL